MPTRQPADSDGLTFPERFELTQQKINLQLSKLQDAMVCNSPLIKM